MDDPPIDTEPLLRALRKLIIDLMEEHQSWDVRIIGYDGNVRLEVGYKDGAFSTRPPKNGAIISKR
jgi:hypothetical protein